MSAGLETVLLTIYWQGIPMFLQHFYYGDFRGIDGMGVDAQTPLAA